MIIAHPPGATSSTITYFTIGGKGIQQGIVTTNIQHCLYLLILLQILQYEQQSSRCIKRRVRHYDSSTRISLASLRSIKSFLLQFHR